MGILSGVASFLGSPLGQATLGLAGNAIKKGVQWLTGRGSSSSAGSSQSNTTSQQAQITQGESTQTGNTASLGGLLADAVSTATSNSGLISGVFNAANAYAANKQQQGNIDKANALNQYYLDQQMEFNAASQAAAMKYNTQEAEANRAWQEQMANTAYQRGVNDLQEAGLNPVLAAYNGYGASTGSGAQGNIGNTSVSGTSAASIPASHAGTMQAMYNYGNNTASFLQQAMKAINSAKQTSQHSEAKLMESIVDNITQTSAQSVYNMAQDIKNENKSQEYYDYRSGRIGNSNNGTTGGGGSGSGNENALRGRRRD